MTESRYRRLLALYPRDFRREYEDEMIGVLMADPRPGPAQVLDILGHAMLAHLRQLAPLPGDGWARSARLVQLFGALLLLAAAVRRVAGIPVRLLRGWIDHLVIDPVDLFRVGAWTVVLIAAVFGLRVVGALGAVAGLAGEIVGPGRYYLDTPAMVLYTYWVMAAAAVVLIAGLAAEPGRLRLRRGRGESAEPGAPGDRVVRGVVPVTVAGALLILHGFWLLLGPWQVRMAMPYAGLALVTFAVYRQAPEVRRRMVAWAVPVVVTLPLTRLGFGGFIEHNMRHPEALRLIGPAQWAALVLIPVAAFMAAAELNRRREATRGRERTGDDGEMAGERGFGVPAAGHVRAHE
ncbi:hypothetical protein [Actinoplanes sp. NPDC051851]|uniref:hypothetical protein n=1 Tax=Actinoplanes sp. NPDC051851 TaxID=3154753 RepID=UPI00344A92CA